MLISTGALRPNSEAPRKTRPGVERGTTNYFNSSNTTDSAQTLRLQRLRLVGIIGERASLLAAMAWEVQHG